MQNIELLDVFEILNTKNSLKCLKDPFVRSALIYFHKFLNQKQTIHKKTFIFSSRANNNAVHYFSSKLGAAIYVLVLVVNFFVFLK